MSENDTAHRRRIEGALARVHGGQASFVGFEVLQGGISGAYTYRLHLADKDAVLKVVLPGADSQVLARGQREIAFYRDLTPRIPLRVPHVLGLHADAASVALLLAAYRPAPQASEWAEQDYLTVAEQLARLHAIYWNATESLSGLTWLHRPAECMSAESVRQASTCWRALAAEPRFAGVFSAQDGRWIGEMLSRVDALDAVIQCLPMTLCHGDCHAGNLVRDRDDRWAWADWQEVGIGCGPEDLSFFFQRARAAGGTVPEDAAIAVYHERLMSDTGHSVPLAAMRQVIAAS
ncbi:MAG TPA: aminoglycoside phosphotransferase family protein, partial [Ktedonobacterales bacterium]|nr:aminoglycoside phosphotransferase family protein [Ktedonobacterales bacterium]